MSAPDSGVRGLRPDLYAGDMEWLSRTAEDEARAILAETERGYVPDWPSKFPEDRTIFCLANEATDALADSLRAFCEGTDGYGYTTYDCLTCQVSAGPMNGLEACAERAGGHDVRARFIVEGN